MTDYSKIVDELLSKTQYIDTEKGTIKLPCMTPLIVPLEDIVQNDYNPNHVAETEMQLLLTSIKENGFTYATTCVYDHELQKFIVVDGFHRYFIFKNCLKAKEMPIVLTMLDETKRRYATVQFNRARGEHSIDAMGNMVASLSQAGASDEEMCEQLGMKVEEIIRLKKLTGIAELFGTREYSKEMIVVDDDY